MPTDDPELEAFLARTTEEDVHIILGLIAGGLADYDNPSYYGEAARRDHLLVPGLDAACRNCHIVARAYRLAAEKPGIVKVKALKNRVTLILRDNLEVWYKKLDEHGRPNYRRSRQSSDYLMPYTPEAPQPRLLDLPPGIMRVVAGYRTGNVADTAWEILVTGRRKAGGWWQAPLFGEEIRQLATAPAPAVASVLRPRVSVRKAKQAHGTDETP